MREIHQASAVLQADMRIADGVVLDGIGELNGPIAVVVASGFVTGPEIRQLFDGRSVVAPNLLFLSSNIVRTIEGDVDGPWAANVTSGVPVYQYTPAETDIEQQIAEIWSTALEISSIGVCDDFLDLGGDSLTAMTIVKRVSTTFDVPLTATDFLEATSVRGLTEFIERARH
jgi:acyl carrier protein